jgi:hypothetical protein
MCYNNIGVLRELFTRDNEMNKYLDAEKALEVVLYVAGSTSDLFHIVKILYYADKLHLEKCGTLITGDFYVAMPEGPVPSGALHLIQYARKDNFGFEDKIANTHPEKAIEVRGDKKDVIVPLRPANLDYLSDTDKECLDEAIAQYAKMDFGTLWKLVHEEESYKKARARRPEKNSTLIPLTDIILLDTPNGSDVLEYLDS